MIPGYDEEIRPLNSESALRGQLLTSHSCAIASEAASAKATKDKAELGLFRCVESPQAKLCCKSDAATRLRAPAELAQR